MQLQSHGNKWRIKANNQISNTPMSHAKMMTFGDVEVATGTRVRRLLLARLAIVRTHETGLPKNYNSWNSVRNDVGNSDKQKRKALKVEGSDRSDTSNYEYVGLLPLTLVQVLHGKCWLCTSEHLMSTWGVAKLSITWTSQKLSKSHQVGKRNEQAKMGENTCKTALGRHGALLRSSSAAPRIRTQASHLSICKRPTHSYSSLMNVCKASNIFGSGKWLQRRAALFLMTCLFSWSVRGG